MLEALTYLGGGISLMTVLILCLWAYFGNPKTGGLFIVWNCHYCGKLNETNVITYFLQWCDHEGLW